MYDQMKSHRKANNVITAMIIEADDKNSWYKDMVGNLIYLKIYADKPFGVCFSMPWLSIDGNDFKIVNGKDIRHNTVKEKFNLT